MLLTLLSAVDILNSATVRFWWPSEWAWSNMELQPWDMPAWGACTLGWISTIVSHGCGVPSMSLLRILIWFAVCYLKESMKFDGAEIVFEGGKHTLIHWLLERLIFQRSAWSFGGSMWWDCWREDLYWTVGNQVNWYTKRSRTCCRPISRNGKVDLGADDYPPVFFLSGILWNIRDET